MCRIRERARATLRRYYNAGTNVEQFFAGLQEFASGRELSKLIRLEAAAEAIIKGEPQRSGITINPAGIYTRHDLIAMGLPRRMVNSLSRTATVQRGQYIGSAIIAALESRAAATQDKHPVSFKARRQHNGRR